MPAFRISESLRAQEIRITVLIMIIYAVGITGISFPWSMDLFIRLIPLVLLLSLAVSLSFHNEYNFKTVAVFTIIVLVSWFVEAAGVSSGALFGKYTYGPALGLKLSGTPLMIGLTWLLLIYGSASLVENFSFPPVLKILTASTIMVLYDLILEFVAPVLGMWHFESMAAPLQNYIAWFLVAFFFHSLLKISGIRTSNRVAAVVFIVQFMFFLVLSLIFHFSK
ncbi:MAG TPA: carotenoid biosynthesis protein [Bacteroidales bacterium]|nr:carotenoid biosynthesis protein [Bacteroidales bacterium]